MSHSSATDEYIFESIGFGDSQCGKTYVATLSLHFMSLIHQDGGTRRRSGHRQRAVQEEGSPVLFLIRKHVFHHRGGGRTQVVHRQGADGGAQ